MNDTIHLPRPKRRKLFRALVILGCAVLAGAAATAFRSWQQRQPVNPVTADGGREVVVMDFAKPLDAAALPAGWLHRTFWTRPAMRVSIVAKDGVPALRCETHASASMLVRWTDIDIEQYPALRWRWLVEQPIASARDERTRDGDDHPVRFFLSFAGADGQTRNAEIIWSNRAFQRGDWKMIGTFPHYVADGGDGNIGQWREESADLVALFQKAGGHGHAARLTQLAIFCDSDDTGGHSVAYTGGPVVVGRQR